MKEDVDTESGSQNLLRGEDVEDPSHEKEGNIHVYANKGKTSNHRERT